MKPLVFKIFFFVGIILLINFICHTFVSPFWGHLNASHKWKIYNDNKKNINTLFIGSSRIYKHIIPKEFDSLASLEGKKINSFNVGVNSFPAPQSFRMLELIVEETDNIDYYFVELTPIYDLINDKIINMPEWNSWYSFKHLILLTEHIFMQPDLARLRKIKRTKEHIQCYLGNIFFIGGAQFYIETMLTDDAWLVEQFRSNNGFVSFESAMLNQAEKSDDLNARLNKFLSDTLVLAKRIEKANKLIELKVKFELVSSYVEELKKMSITIKNKGGKLFFIIPPRLENYEGYKYYSGLLNDSNILDLSNPNEYPEFYQAKNSFDVGHLNLKGAKLFTKELYNLIKKNNGFN